MRYPTNYPRYSTNYLRYPTYYLRYPTNYPRYPTNYLRYPTKDAASLLCSSPQPHLPKLAIMVLLFFTASWLKMCQLKPCTPCNLDAMLIFGLDLISAASSVNTKQVDDIRETSVDYPISCGGIKTTSCALCLIFL